MQYMYGAVLQPRVRPMMMHELPGVSSSLRNDHLCRTSCSKFNRNNMARVYQCAINVAR